MEHFIQILFSTGGLSAWYGIERCQESRPGQHGASGRDDLANRIHMTDPPKTRPPNSNAKARCSALNRPPSSPCPKFRESRLRLFFPRREFALEACLPRIRRSPCEQAAPRRGRVQGHRGINGGEPRNGRRPFMSPSPCMGAAGGERGGSMCEVSRACARPAESRPGTTPSRP